MNHPPMTLDELAVIKLTSSVQWKIQREVGAPDCEAERDPQEQADAFAEKLYALMGPHLSLRHMRALVSVFHRELGRRETEKLAAGMGLSGTTAIAVPLSPTSIVRMFMDERPVPLEQLGSFLARHEHDDPSEVCRHFAETLVKGLAPKMSLCHLEHLASAVSQEVDEHLALSNRSRNAD